MPTSEELKEIQKHNKELLQLGQTQGIAHYKWMHGSDPEGRVPMVMTTKSGDPIKEFVCACGIDVVVHQPWCKSLILARNKGELQSVVPGLEQKWVLMRWMPPPSRQDWVESFGDQFPFPRQGYYLPVSAKGNHIALDQAPLIETTRFVIGILKAQQDIKAMNEETNEREKRKKKNRLQRWFDAFQASAPVGDDKPGTKHNVSLPTVVKS